MNITRRVGRFMLSKDFIDEYPEVIMAIMGKMIVFRAEYLLDRNAVDYSAMSTLFDDVDPGVIAPNYRIICFGSVRIPDELVIRAEFYDRSRAGLEWPYHPSGPIVKPEPE